MVHKFGEVFFLFWGVFLIGFALFRTNELPPLYSSKPREYLLFGLESFYRILVGVSLSYFRGMVAPFVSILCEFG